MARDCEVGGCGITAIGRCNECQRPFCRSHQHVVVWQQGGLPPVPTGENRCVECVARAHHAAVLRKQAAADAEDARIRDALLWARDLCAFAARVGDRGRTLVELRGGNGSVIDGRHYSAKGYTDPGPRFAEIGRVWPYTYGHEPPRGYAFDEAGSLWSVSVAEVSYYRPSVLRSWLGNKHVRRSHDGVFGTLIGDATGPVDASMQGQWTAAARTAAKTRAKLGNG